MWKMIRRKACIDFTGRSWNLFFSLLLVWKSVCKYFVKTKIKKFGKHEWIEMAIKIMIIFFSNGIESLIPAPMLYITSFLFFFLKKLSEDHQPRVALTWGMAVFFSNSHQTHRSGLPCLKTFWVLAFFTIRSYETLSVTLRAVLLAALFFFF